MDLPTFYFTKWLRILALFALLSCSTNARQLIYFFDPQCGHCEAVARQMAAWKWGSTEIVAVPVNEPRYAAAFLRATGLAARLEIQPELRRIYPFRTPPHAILLRNGRVVRQIRI